MPSPPICTYIPDGAAPTKVTCHVLRTLEKSPRNSAILGSEVWRKRQDEWEIRLTEKEYELIQKKGGELPHKDEYDNGNRQTNGRPKCMSKVGNSR